MKFEYALYSTAFIVLAAISWPGAETAPVLESDTVPFASTSTIVNISGMTTDDIIAALGGDDDDRKIASIL